MYGVHRCSWCTLNDLPSETTSGYSMLFAYGASYSWHTLK